MFICPFVGPLIWTNKILSYLILSNTYVGQKLKKNAHYIFYLHIFISWKKKGGGAVH